VVVTVGERGGLPLAAQLVGVPGSERLLLAVAALLHAPLPVDRP
jgi:Asp-tRNA(Asn)/Glu-tRNA(Gln) amidotransferase A subunit family amidase